MRKVFCLILVLAMALVFMPVSAHAASGTRTLSGTLTFSSPVKANTEIYVYVGYAYGPFWYGDQYSKTIEVKAGATKADFSLSVAPEVYILEFDGPQEWFYYGVEDKLTDDYSQRMYFDLMEKSVTGLSVKGDALLAGGSSNTDVNVNVTINLPEKLSESKQLCIIAGTEEDSWITSSWPTVKAGESKAAVTFSLPANEKYYFYYADATGSDWVGDDRTGFLYGAESGVSSLRSKAKLYDISKSTSVTLSYPTYYTVSGKLDRTGYVDGSPAVAYVIAEFADGERYTDRVVYAENEKTKSFKIYVPRSQKGNSYTLYTAPAENVNDIGVITSMQKKIDTYTLSGNKSAGTLTMGSLSFIKYSGTIGLPSGLKAPAGGVTVQLSSYQDDIYLDFGNVTIPEGASSASFSFLSKAEVSKLTASLTAPVAGAFYEVTATVSGHSGINVTFPEEAVISGTVYFPEGTDAAYVGEIRAEMDQAYCYTSFAMRHGENSAKYYLHVKKGDKLHFIDLYSTYDSSGKFKDTAVFVDSNWQQTSSYPEGSSVVSGNKSGVDIHLIEPIHGMVHRPAFIGDFGVDVYVKTDKVGDPYTAYAWARAGMDSADYSIEIPSSDTSSTYKLYYELSYCDGLKAGTWYLKADGTFTEDPAQAASFPISVRTQDFTPLAADPFVKGKIYVPDAVGEDSNLSVTLHSYVKTSADLYETYNYYTFPLDEEDLKKDKNGRYFEYAIASESLKESGTFCLEYWANNEDLDRKDFYVLADGTVTPVSEGAYCFTYNGSSPVTRDFKLLPWDDGVKYVFESGHGLIDETVTYTYTYPGECDSLTLTFTNRSNDTVNINGTPYATAAPVTVTGKKAAVEVTFEGTNRYGFAVTDITPNGVTKKKSGVAAVYTPDGDSTADVVKDLKDTKEVSATVSTDGIATGTKLVGHAALYDKDGRFLGLSKADGFVADGSSNAGLTLTFDKVSKDTAQVTVVVIDQDFKPMGECMTK